MVGLETIALGLIAIGIIFVIVAVAFFILIFTKAFSFINKVEEDMEEMGTDESESDIGIPPFNK